MRNSTAARAAAAAAEAAEAAEAEAAAAEAAAEWSVRSLAPSAETPAQSTLPADMPTDADADACTACVPMAAAAVAPVPVPMLVPMGGAAMRVECTAGGSCRLEHGGGGTVTCSGCGVVGCDMTPSAAPATLGAGHNGGGWHGAELMGACGAPLGTAPPVLPPPGTQSASFEGRLELLEQRMNVMNVMAPVMSGGAADVAPIDVAAYYDSRHGPPSPPSPPLYPPHAGPAGVAPNEPETPNMAPNDFDDLANELRAIAKEQLAMLHQERFASPCAAACAACASSHANGHGSPTRAPPAQQAQPAHGVADAPSRPAAADATPAAALAHSASYPHHDYPRSALAPTGGPLPLLVAPPPGDANGLSAAAAAMTAAAAAVSASAQAVTTVATSPLPPQHAAAEAHAAGGSSLAPFRGGTTLINEGELHETLKLLHESRADALEQLQASQSRAREHEREQMQGLMKELRSWKRQNERRMAELTARSCATLTPFGEMRVPERAAGGAAHTAPSYAATPTAARSHDDDDDDSDASQPRRSPALPPSRSAARPNAASSIGTTPRGLLSRGGRLAEGAPSASRFGSVAPLEQHIPPPPHFSSSSAAELTEEEAPHSRKRPLGSGALGGRLSSREPPSAGRLRAPPAATTFAGARQAPPAARAPSTYARQAPTSHLAIVRSTPGRSANGTPERPEGEGRSLRELQRELESLKSSLSVYLGSGLAR